VRDALAEASLVLTALDIDNDIVADGGYWCLMVRPADASRASRELEAYRAENPGASRANFRIPTIDSGWAGVAAYLLIIWLLPSVEGAATFGWNWLAIGQLQAGEVAQGAWWRTITALTLHADLGHLLGNSIFGALFGLFAGRHLGSGLAWLLILLCGALGNGVDAWLRPEDFRAIGASTATFAALALVGGFVWRRGYYSRIGWRRSLAPIFAAIALLAFTGVSGENIDVVAHFAGFLLGLGCGVLIAGVDVRRLGRSGQWLAGFAAIALVVAAWTLAGLDAGVEVVSVTG
jgi:membrane associated rhomboid family serine protease